MDPYLQQIYNQAYQDTMVKLATAAQQPITAKGPLTPDIDSMAHIPAAREANVPQMLALLNTIGYGLDENGEIVKTPTLGSPAEGALRAGIQGDKTSEIVGAARPGNYAAARKSLEGELKAQEDNAQLMKILAQAGIIGGAGAAGAGIGALAAGKGKRGRGAVGGGLGAMVGAGAGEVANAYLGDMLKQKTGLDPNVLRGILSGGGAALGTAGGIALA